MQAPRTFSIICLTKGPEQYYTPDRPLSCSEETACRFCYGDLPDWRTAFNLPTATPVMTVSHNSVQHLLEVKPGEAGKVEFQQNIRRIFGLSPEDVIELTFGCKAPGTGKLLPQLSGHLSLLSSRLVCTSHAVLMTNIVVATCRSRCCSHGLAIL